MRVWGLLLGGLVVAACGHEQVTGSARNDWATPTGSGSVAQSEQKVVNPDNASHRARDRNAFRAQAPTLQPAPAATEPVPPPPPSEIAPLNEVPPPATTPPPDVP